MSPSHRPLFLFGVVCVALIGLFSIFARPAAAAAITAEVVPFADVLNGADGKCSLAEAVIAANTNSSAHEAACTAGQASPTVDTISIPAGTHYAADPNVNDQTALLISETVIISGAGVGTTIIAPGADDNAISTDGLFTNNDTHGFFILSDDVTIQNLTIDGLANAALGSNIEFRTGITSNALPLDNITLQNIAIQNVLRRGVSVAAGVNALVDNVDVSNLETGMNGIGISMFGAATNAAVTIRNSSIQHFGNGISVSSTGAASNSGLFTVEDNEISNLQVITAPNPVFGYGMLIANARTGSSIHSNDITLTDDGAMDIGLYVSRNLEQGAATAGTLTIGGNTVTVAGADTGVVLYRNAVIGSSAFTQTVVVSDNTIDGDNTSSTFLESTGIYISDDSATLSTVSDPRPTYAEVESNSVTGFNRGVHVRRAGVSGTYATGQPIEVVVNANDLSGNTAGLDAEGHAAGGSALVSTADGDNLIDGNGVGVRASANASVTLGNGAAGECVVSNTTFGAQNSGGTLSIVNSWWGSSAGAGIAANGTDGTVTSSPFSASPIVRPSTAQPCQPSYGNYVWYDSDSDGVQDVGEPAASGVTVNVYDSGGIALLGSLPTDANGVYRVGRSGAANTVLEVDAARPLSPALQGGDPALDSNFDTTTHRATVSPNGIDDTIDAGLVPVVGLLINRTTAPGLSLTDDVTMVTEGTTVGDQLAIRLGSQPSANVTIQVGVNDPAQLKVSTAAAPQTLLDSYTITFEPVNTSASIPDWNQWVVVNIGALFDGVTEGLHTSTVTFSVVTGGAAEFDTMPSVSEDVNIYEPNLILSPYNPAPMQEGGAATYTVRLASPPGLALKTGGAEVVTVTPAGYNVNFASVSPATLTFNRSNWDVPQQLTVTAINDTVDRGTYAVTINHGLKSTVKLPMDTYYGNAPTIVPKVQQRITIVDNDLAGEPMPQAYYDALNAAAWFDPQALGYPITAGMSNIGLQIRLNGQPTEDETVTVTLASEAGVILTPSTLTFTYYNWNVYQPVTITAPLETGGTWTIPVQMTVTGGIGDVWLNMEGAAAAVEVQVSDTPAAPPAPPEVPAAGFAPAAEPPSDGEGSVSE